MASQISQHYQVQFQASIAQAISKSTLISDFAKHYAAVQSEDTVTPRELGISLKALNKTAEQFKAILGLAYQVTNKGGILEPCYLEFPKTLTFKTDIDNYKAHNKQIFDRFPPALQTKIETETNKQNTIKHTCATM